MPVNTAVLLAEGNIMLAFEFLITAAVVIEITTVPYA
jgi:hypothetical protein